MVTVPTFVVENAHIQNSCNRVQSDARSTPPSIDLLGKKKLTSVSAWHKYPFYMLSVIQIGVGHRRFADQNPKWPIFFQERGQNCRLKSHSWDKMADRFFRKYDKHRGSDNLGSKQTRVKSSSRLIIMQAVYLKRLYGCDLKASQCHVGAICFKLRKLSVS